jgi:hypothetical protein
MTSSELFNAMSPALAAEIFEYLHTEEREFYKAALEAVAKLRRVRTVFLERQPKQERFEALKGSLGRPNMSLVADNLIRAWLLKRHSALLGDFLDALGIQHEKGVVEDLPKNVEEAPLRNAVELCLEKYGEEPTAVYLHAFNSMNDAKWASLEALLHSEPRLRLPGAPGPRGA